MCFGEGRDSVNIILLYDGDASIFATLTIVPFG